MNERSMRFVDWYCEVFATLQQMQGFASYTQEDLCRLCPSHVFDILCEKKTETSRVEQRSCRVARRFLTEKAKILKLCCRHSNMTFKGVSLFCLSLSLSLSLSEQREGETLREGRGGDDIN